MQYEQVIDDCFETVLGKKIEQDQKSIPLKDIGMDSLDFIDVVYEIENRLDTSRRIEIKENPEITYSEFVDLVLADVNAQKLAY